jgi:predicted metal-dependent hydrolase
VPRGAAEADALAFARQKEEWLRGHLGRRPDEIVVAHGARLPVEGVPLTVAPGRGRAIRIEGERLLVPGPEGRAGAALAGWLKARARDRLAAASDRHAAALGRPYARLTLRDTRSRWGSCSAAGGLNYSWRLILAPAEVLDYVAAHEVAHLAEMNHSPAFWAVVERLYGDWRPARHWLHENGPALHRFRFTP